MIVIGIDPGMTGAFARYDSASGELDVQDMPIWRQSTGKTTRNRINEIGIRDYFELQKLFGVDLAVLEAVGGRPRQSASAAYVFGDGVGVIRGTMTCCRIPWETTPANVWKRLMRVPTDDVGIRQAFLQRLPQHAHLIEGGRISHGDRKGEKSVKDGRAEAALLAIFGATHLQGKPLDPDPAHKMVFARQRGTRK